MFETFECSKCCGSTFNERVEILDFVKWTWTLSRISYFVDVNIFLLNLGMKIDIEK